MRIDVVLIVTGVFRTAIWAFLFFQGLRLQIIRVYPLAFVYFACQFAVFWVTTAAAITLGPDNPLYYWIYYCSIIPVDLLGLLILLRIYHLPYRPSLRKDWPVIVVLPIFIYLAFAQPFFLGYQVYYVLFLYLTVVGFLAGARLYFCDNVEIGGNLGGLLAGITVPAGLQSVNQTLTYLGAEWWPYDAFWVVNELTTAICWCIIAYGMRRYDPPTALTQAGKIDGDEAARLLKRLNKAFWRW